MDTLEIKGKIYQKSSLIAEKFGYTTDYVGQLCRENKVDAKRVGRAWYVDPASVLNYQDSRYESEEENKQPVIKVVATSKKPSAKKSVNEIISTTQRQTQRAVDWGVSRPTAPVYVPRYAYEIDENDLFPTPTKIASAARQEKNSNTLAINKGDSKKTPDNKDFSEVIPARTFVFTEKKSNKSKPKHTHTLAEVKDNRLVIPPKSPMYKDGEITNNTGATKNKRPYTTTRNDLKRSRRPITKTVRPGRRRLRLARLLSLALIGFAFALIFWSHSQLRYQKESTQLSEGYGFTVPTWEEIKDFDIIHFFYLLIE